MHVKYSRIYSAQINLTEFLQWARRQFPVPVAFAVTIDTNQGQSLHVAGVWLEEPVFTHGTYVASSREGNPSNVRFATIAIPGFPFNLT